MLRPVSEPDNYATTALRTGAISMGKDLFEFVESLDTNHMEAFWPSCQFSIQNLPNEPKLMCQTDSRTNFMIASNFMLLLFVTSPNLTDAHECLDLLNSWRSLLRIKSRSGDLLNLALLRLDALFVSGLDKTINLSPSALQVFGEQQSD